MEMAFRCELVALSSAEEMAPDGERLQNSSPILYDFILTGFAGSVQVVVLPCDGTVPSLDQNCVGSSLYDQTSYSDSSRSAHASSMDTMWPLHPSIAQKEIDTASTGTIHSRQESPDGVLRVPGTKSEGYDTQKERSYRDTIKNLLLALKSWEDSIGRSTHEPANHSISIHRLRRGANDETNEASFLPGGDAVISLRLRLHATAGDTATGSDCCGGQRRQ